MEMIENRMLMDLARSEHGEETAEKLSEPGYREIFMDTFVADEDAFDYAIERCVKSAPHGFRYIEWTDEFKEMVAEWFYSGNWVHEYGR